MKKKLNIPLVVKILIAIAIGVGAGQFAPVWDFDWAFGVNKNGQRFFEGSPHHDFWDRSFSLSNEFWIDLRFLNPGFQDIYYKVWAEFMDSGLSQLLDFCEKSFFFT